MPARWGPSSRTPIPKWKLSTLSPGPGPVLFLAVIFTTFLCTMLYLVSWKIYPQKEAFWHRCAVISSSPPERWWDQLLYLVKHCYVKIRPLKKKRKIVSRSARLTFCRRIFFFFFFFVVLSWNLPQIVK